MPSIDRPIAELREYHTRVVAPADLEQFWDRTLAETRSHDLDARFELLDTPFPLLRTYDVRFAGFGPIHPVR